MIDCPRLETCAHSQPYALKRHQEKKHLTSAAAIFRRIVTLFILAALLAAPMQAQSAKTQKKKATAVSAAPAKDPNAVDWEAITRIRSEAFHNSQVMETLRYLTDHIGSRLTGSPKLAAANQWTKERLTSYGLENAHLEPWGPFGLGWSYEKSDVRMVSPDKVQLLALPKAWTPATNGVLRASVIKAVIATKEDMAKYKGKLAGSIIAISEPRELKVQDKPALSRYDEASLAEFGRYPIPSGEPANTAVIASRNAFQKELMKYLVEEKALAVIEPSRSPGDGGTIFVQGGGSYRKGESVGVPWVVMAVEHYGRIVRLLENKQSVELEMEVKTQFHEGDPFGYNTIAEIPGTDLKDEVVMLGGHLDSWHGATGATDDAAGVSVMMEAVRILKTLGLQPRRTIRIALWTGEEQGLMGSRGYVSEHFASRPENTAPEHAHLPPFLRPAAGPLTLKPEHGKISVYANVDSGTGKIRGLNLQENAALIPIVQPLIEPFKDVGMTTISMRKTGGSDHVPFDAVGIPVFDFEQDAVEYDTRTHHSNIDSFERIQRADMLQASAVVAAFVYHAAMRDQILPRKPLPKDPEPVKPPAPADAEKKPAAPAQPAKN